MKHIKKAHNFLQGQLVVALSVVLLAIYSNLYLYPIFKQHLELNHALLQSQQAGPQSVVLSKSEMVEYMADMVLEELLGERYVFKWQQPEVAVSFKGNFDEQDLACTDSVLLDLNELVETVQFKRTLAKAGEIELVFIPKQNFSDYSDASELKTAVGFTQKTLYGNLAIKYAFIGIATDLIQGSERCAVIRHELTHAIGVKHSTRDHESVMGTHARKMTFSPLDEDIIRFLYKESVVHGMKEADLKKAIADLPYNHWPLSTTYGPFISTKVLTQE